MSQTADEEPKSDGGQTATEAWATEAWAAEADDSIAQSINATRASMRAAAAREDYAAALQLQTQLKDLETSLARRAVSEGVQHGVEKTLPQVSAEARQLVADARATDRLLWEWVVECERRPPRPEGCVAPEHLTPAYGTSTGDFFWPLHCIGH